VDANWTGAPTIYAVNTLLAASIRLLFTPGDAGWAPEGRKVYRLMERTATHAMSVGNAGVIPQYSRLGKRGGDLLLVGKHWKYDGYGCKDGLRTLNHWITPCVPGRACPCVSYQVRPYWRPVQETPDCGLPSVVYLFH
jgi:hypothetical protein